MDEMDVNEGASASSYTNVCKHTITKLLKAIKINRIWLTHLNHIRIDFDFLPMNFVRTFSHVIKRSYLEKISNNR